jgi:hypothetical protein
LPKNVITRALGMQDQVMVDLQSDEPQPGDVYLLCSDGLSGMIGDDEILDILMSTGDIIEGCRRLVARANEHGGEDNITAVLVRIDEGPSPNLTSTRPPSRDDETTVRGALPPVSVKSQPDDTPPAAPAAVPSASPLIESEPTLPTGAVPPPARDSNPPPPPSKR